jgi:hypothetical protein
METAGYGLTNIRTDVVNEELFEEQTVVSEDGKRFFRLFTEYVRQSAHRDENLPNGRPSTTVSVVSRLFSC